ncbi:MAG TPA: hypothetical protein VJ914_12945 [Pseudonocardiaceae bacterium]|nr:hypothetical protein [Pseudonocardiaceae bacterium]
MTQVNGASIEIMTPSAAGSETITLRTAHCTIVAVDIEGFGRRSRTNLNQVRVRHGMYRSMHQAFDVAGIPWTSCHREDRGDGILVLAPADVPKVLFGDYLPGALVRALTAHNAAHPVEERIRLRLALHAGEITYDEHGVTASSITHTFRLVDAAALRAKLAKSAATLAVISSDWFYDEVVRHSERSAARSYRSINVTTKETSTRAWVRLLQVPRAELESGLAG